MTPCTLFFATNRRHEGGTRLAPQGYGREFSKDGFDNLRFGRVDLRVDDAEVARLLAAPAEGEGNTDGGKLATYFQEAYAASGVITTYPEKAEPGKPPLLGSAAMFAELEKRMRQLTDVVVYIHGFNVEWEEAVGAALALQAGLNDGEIDHRVDVVLFSWPSDGQVTPFSAYRNDRRDAAASGEAIGRAFLKLRDFLARLRVGRAEMCGQELHLLCHSMGNYALQNALTRMEEHTTGNALPRLFDHLFLCAPDVDDTVFETGQPLARIHELTRTVTVYHNQHDRAMDVSDFTKGNPERLGGGGAARPTLLHAKVHQVDCTAVVTGLVQHSYYLSGLPLDDIRASVQGVPLDANTRRRIRSEHLPNVWTLR